MLERIQYALFILLFVLAGSMDGARIQSGRVDIRPGLFRKSTFQAPVPVHNYLTTAVVSCDAPIENPGQPSGQKAIVRLRHDARTASSADVAVHRSAHSGCFILHPRPVDYYVFSLGRILI